MTNTTVLSIEEAVERVNEFITNGGIEFKTIESDNNGLTFIFEDYSMMRNFNNDNLIIDIDYTLNNGSEMTRNYMLVEFHKEASEETILKTINEQVKLAKKEFMTTI